MAVALESQKQSSLCPFDLQDVVCAGSLPFAVKFAWNLY